jgi:hypothetical protein
MSGIVGGAADVIGGTSRCSRRYFVGLRWMMSTDRQYPKGRAVMLGRSLMLCRWVATGAAIIIPFDGEVIERKFR